jgi:hemolysin activation/secretion protein
LAACVAASFSLGWTAAHAQSASQITPKTFTPPQQAPLSPSLHLAAPGVEAPPGADKLYVTPAGVELDGGFPAFAADFAEVRATLVGHRISGADIYAAARKLETAYARAGYVLVRITVPAQDIADGDVIRLQVIDGYIERIETRRLPWRVRDRIAALVAPLAGHGHVLEKDLERRLLVAGDAPGVILRSTLAPGSVVGATVLVVEAAYQPVSVSLTGDNSLAQSLGRYPAGVGLTFNSPFGLGEQVYLRASGDLSGGVDGYFDLHARNRILAAGAIAPIGNDGLTVNVEGTLARTTPSTATGGPPSTDQFERLSLRLRYPWLRSRSLNISSQLVFDAEDEEDWVLSPAATLPISLDRLRVIRVVTEADYLAPWGGEFSASLTPSFGLDALGARTAADATPTLPLSAQGANANFRKLAANAAYNQTLLPHLAIALSGSAQTSFGHPLAHSEAFGVAGPGQLSAFDAGTLQGDSGYVGRAELSAPLAPPRLAPSLSVNVVASPYLFGAYGEVFLSDATAVQQAHVRAGAYGLGLRLFGGAAGSTSNGQISLEYGREVRTGASGADRLSLMGSVIY